MRLLIIGSLAGQIGAASRVAIGRGAKVLQAEDLATGLQSLRAGAGADLVLVDVMLDVASLIANMQAERITVPVVACGVGNSTRSAVAAIKAGAREYLPLPPDPELISAILAAASQDTHAIVHADPRTAALLAVSERVAASEASVLLVGASGTGKELLARFLHARSRRGDARFVAVNCAAIPEALLASELFGHDVHRGRRAPDRSLRGGERRNAAARRDQRDGSAPAGEAAARRSGTGDRSRRRLGAGQGGRADSRDLQPQPGRGGRARLVPRRPLLSAQRRFAADPGAG